MAHDSARRPAGTASSQGQSLGGNRPWQCTSPAHLGDIDATDLEVHAHLGWSGTDPDRDDPHGTHVEDHLVQHGGEQAPTSPPGDQTLVEVPRHRRSPRRRRSRRWLPRLRRRTPRAWEPTPRYAPWPHPGPTSGPKPLGAPVSELFSPARRPPFSHRGVPETTPPGRAPRHRQSITAVPRPTVTKVPASHHGHLSTVVAARQASRHRVPCRPVHEQAAARNKRGLPRSHDGRGRGLRPRQGGVQLQVPQARRPSGW